MQCLFRFMPGWGDYFVEHEVGCGGEITESQMVDDASSAMLIVFLLFVFPAELSFWPFTSREACRVSPALLACPRAKSCGGFPLQAEDRIFNSMELLIRSVLHAVSVPLMTIF